jgi:hypothetical protein
MECPALLYERWQRRAGGLWIHATQARRTSKVEVFDPPAVPLATDQETPTDFQRLRGRLRGAACENADQLIEELRGSNPAPTATGPGALALCQEIGVTEWELKVFAAIIKVALAGAATWNHPFLTAASAR